MLKKGCAWHYTAYDQRPELAKVSSTDRCHRANLITCDRKREIFLRPFNLLLRFGNVVVPTQKNILRPVQIVCLKDINSRMEGVNHKTHLNFLSLSVGETGTGWPQGPVGVVQASETMGVEEGQTQWNGLNRSCVL
jgi:hypothetical protein